MMKLMNWCAAALVLAAGCPAFAQGADYAALLARAREYEAGGQYAHALGAYWDAAAAERSEKAADAVEGYLALEAAIEGGRPGYGDFDEFSLYDGWVLLLQDFERYWTEHPAVGFKIGGITKDGVDHATRTASYGVRVWWGYSRKAQDMAYSLRTGLAKARERDWAGVPAAWPFVSVYAGVAEEDGQFLRDGAALFYDSGYGYDDHVAPAAFSVGQAPNGERGEMAGRFLYDYGLALVDGDGNVLARSTGFDRHDGGWGDWHGGDDFAFEGVTPEAMRVIDAGKAEAVITSLALRYGCPDYYAGADWDGEWNRLPAVTYSAAEALLIADDVDEIYGSPYVKAKEAAAQAEKEAAEAKAAKAEKARKASAREGADRARAERRAARSFAVPDGTTVLEADMLADYVAIETVYIPASVIEIKADAFARCEALRAVGYYGTKKQWKELTKNHTARQGNGRLLKAKVDYLK